MACAGVCATRLNTAAAQTAIHTGNGLVCFMLTFVLL
jgi:hypothetical protein